MSIRSHPLAAASFLAIALSAPRAFAEHWWRCTGDADPVQWLSIRQGQARLTQDDGAVQQTSRATLTGWAATLDGAPVTVYARFDSGWFAFQDESFHWYVRAGDRSIGLSCDMLSDR
jgi:hypothetical protein